MLSVPGIFQNKVVFTGICQFTNTWIFALNLFLLTQFHAYMGYFDSILHDRLLASSLHFTEPILPDSLPFLLSGFCGPLYVIRVVYTSRAYLNKGNLPLRNMTLPLPATFNCLCLLRKGWGLMSPSPILDGMPWAPLMAQVAAAPVSLARVSVSPLSLLAHCRSVTYRA